MRVLPVLFNTDMVRAILDGRKTVTRRICKDGDDYTVPDMGFYSADKRTYAVHSYADKGHKDKLSIVERPCPFCPGDILYVREKWCRNPASGEYYYVANRKKGAEAPYGLKWHPSIHMPKKVARIWLKVTDVRVELLQKIDNVQILAEGANPCAISHYIKQMPEESEEWIHAAHVVEFQQLWDSAIKKVDIDRYGWDANPWVWVIEFERCEKPDENESAGSSEWKDNFMQIFCKVN